MKALPFRILSDAKSVLIGPNDWRTLHAIRTYCEARSIQTTFDHIDGIDYLVVYYRGSKEEFCREFKLSRRKPSRRQLEKTRLLEEAELKRQHEAAEQSEREKAAKELRDLVLKQGLEERERLKHHLIYFELRRKCEQDGRTFDESLAETWSHLDPYRMSLADLTGILPEPPARIEAACSLHYPEWEAVKSAGEIHWSTFVNAWRNYVIDVETKYELRQPPRRPYWVRRRYCAVCGNKVNPDSGFCYQHWSPS